MAKYKTLYTTEYFEEYARLCLNDFFNLKLIHRKERYGKNGDRPDLISGNEEIGVEVTEGKTERDGRHDKIFQQEYPQDESINERIENESKRLGVNNYLKFIVGLAVLENECSVKHTLEGILGAVDKKLNDLNKKRYNLYKSNQLFIFVNIFPSYIDKIKEEV